MARAPKGTPYAAKPWLKLFAPGLLVDIAPDCDDALSLFRAAAERAPDAIVIPYFDGAVSDRRLDELSDAFAAALTEGGFHPGDRLALQLPNVPAFPIAALARTSRRGIMAECCGHHRLDVPGHFGAPHRGRPSAKGERVRFHPEGDP